MKGFELLILTVILTITALDYMGAQGDVLYRVGDVKGWDQSVNYTEWSTRQHIYVDNWIIFNFNKHLYNVLEVNKTSYENCNEQDFIKNITRGGRDVFQLTEPKTYYFISGGGYCWHGMKLALDVHEIPPATAPPVPPAATTKNGASSSSVEYNWIVLFLISLISMVLFC